MLILQNLIKNKLIRFTSKLKISSAASSVMQKLPEPMSEISHDL